MDSDPRIWRNRGQNLCTRTTEPTDDEAEGCRFYSFVFHERRVAQEAHQRRHRLARPREQTDARKSGFLPG